MNYKKILSLLLSAAILGSLCACTGEAGLDTPAADAKPAEIVSDPGEQLVEGTLHKVSVTPSDRVFITEDEDGASTEYAIVAGQGELNVEAAVFMAKHIGAATGASPEILSGEEVSDAGKGKYIFINCREQFDKAGLQMPGEDIGQRGYYIKSVEDDVYIATKAEAGAQLAAIAFLREVLGYQIFADDTVAYSLSGATLPDMDITERPDYDFYIPVNKLDATTAYAMGYQDQLDVFIRVTSATDSFGMWHNSLEYLPYEDNKDAHPDWYSDVVYGSEMQRELCYTAHGDQEELQAMVDVIAARMLKEAAANPLKSTICLTIEDHNTICPCEACTASAAKYNGSNAAAVIQLLNRVNEIVQKSLQEEADAAGTQKRELNILFFAYHKMLKAPAVKNAQGVWEPVDESVVCAPEVGVYYAPIEAYYPYSFNHEKNVEHKENTQAWGAISNKIYMWTYCTNFGHYLFPYNTFDAMLENYRFFKEAGATFMYNQGQHNQNNATHFTAFKEYLTSRALFNVNESLEDMTDDFFANYFMDAQEPMRQYYDELQAHLGYLAAENPVQINGYIREEIASLEYWPKETLQQWLGYIDEAYAAIEKYRDTDPERYAVLYKHILRESIFPRYAMLELHFGSYYADELRTCGCSSRPTARPWASPM